MTLFLLVLFLLLPASGATEPICTALVQADDADARVVEIDLATGVVSEVLSGLDLDFADVRGILRTEDTLLLCQDDLLHSVSLRDGAVTELSITCRGVAAGEDGSVVLLAPSGETSESFASAAEAVDLRSPSLSAVRLGIASTGAVDGTDILVAGPAGVEVKRRSLVDGSAREIFEPSSVFGAIWGMSQVDGVLYLLDDGRDPETDERGPPGVRAFDLAASEVRTSAELEYPPSESVRGLWCALP